MRAVCGGAVCVRVLSARQGRDRRSQDALRVSTGAQGRHLREPPGPELRVQGRQAERRGLRHAAGVAGRRSRGHSGRDGDHREDAVTQAVGEGRPGMKTSSFDSIASATSLRMTKFVVMAIVTGALCTVAAAQHITGTVTNGTTGKPAAGDEVTLLSLSQGMQEVGTTKTDAQGRFSMAAPGDQGAPHMVRVTHDGVNYFPQGGPLMPGATTTMVTVYDTAKKLDGVSQTVEVDRFQTDASQLQVIALFAIKNGSSPPRSLDGDKTFEFMLPAGAEIDSGMAKSPGGQPLNMMPTETGQKGRYSFSFPLRPGETQFQVSYHMPYSGEASFSPKPLADVQHFVVMTPKGMTFTPKDAQRFQSMPDNSGAGIMVATNAKPGEDLSFKLTGSGQFQAEGQQAAGGGDDGSAAGGMGGGQAAGRDNRPGGGLGAPIDSNDPLHDYRAVILGVFAVVLVMGGAFVISKSNHQVLAAKTTAAAEVVEVAPAASRTAALLEELKEELFQLEIDRQQGKVSAEEYSKAKAALDETIKRALARTGNS